MGFYTYAPFKRFIYYHHKNNCKIYEHQDHIWLVMKKFIQTFKNLEILLDDGLFQYLECQVPHFYMTGELDRCGEDVLQP